MAARKKKMRIEWVHNREQRRVLTLDENWAGWHGEFDQCGPGSQGALLKLRPSKGLAPGVVEAIKSLCITNGAAVVLVEPAREDAPVAATATARGVVLKPGAVVRQLALMSSYADALVPLVEGHLVRVGL